MAQVTARKLSSVYLLHFKPAVVKLCKPIQSIINYFLLHLYLETYVRILIAVYKRTHMHLTGCWIFILLRKLQHFVKIFSLFMRAVNCLADVFVKLQLLLDILAPGTSKELLVSDFCHFVIFKL